MHNQEIDLEHETRKMVYNHIITYPGVSFSVLKTVFGLTEGTLRYHLKFLEKGERIHSSLENGKRFYYPNYGKTLVQRNSDNTLISHKLTLVQKQILDTIKKNPSINQKELIKRTGLKRFKVTYNLTKLIEMGCIQKSNLKKNVCYEYITDELLKFEIIKILAVKLLKNEIDEETFRYLKNKLDLRT